jgi:hypothetical protein
VRSQVVTRVVSVFLIVLLPSALLMADTKGAMLYANGAVVLNGVAVKSTVGVFDGDRVDTANNALVTINQQGTTVGVDPNSGVTYRKNAIDVRHGSVRVSTDHGMAVRVDQFSVTPKQETAKFTVAKLDNKVVVTSREGSLVLGGAAKSVVLPPGMSASLPLDPPPAGGGGGGSAGGGGGPTAWEVTAVAVAVAGAGIAIGLAATNTGISSTSPVHP